MLLIGCRYRKRLVKAAYNHAEYMPERRDMMQAWSDWIDSLATAAQTGSGSIAS